MTVYAGIGSRATPDNILGKMRNAGSWHASLGYILRSGGAIGADTAFEQGARSVTGQVEIYLASDCTAEAEELSSKFHNNWDACSSYARRLHGRNAMIILGKNLDDPVDFVMCWTKGGYTVGGTGQAIRIANHYGIPVINLFER